MRALKFYSWGCWVSNSNHGYPQRTGFDVNFQKIIFQLSSNIIKYTPYLFIDSVSLQSGHFLSLGFGLENMSTAILVLLLIQEGPVVSSLDT